MTSANSDKSSSIVWTMWFLGAIFYAYQYILRVLPNVLMPEIIENFQIDAQIFGQFSGIYYLGYAIMHIPLGILLDRFGPKTVMPICVLLTALGALPLVISEAWIYPCIGRALIGLGSSAAILGVFKIIRYGFDESKFSQMLGFAVTIGLLGAIYGGRPLNFLIGILGWQNVVYLIVAFGVVLAAGMFLIFPKQPKAEQKQPQDSIFKNTIAVLSNIKVLTICILAGLMVGPLEGFADVWGTEYLKIAYSIEDTVAAGLPSFIFIGMCVGSPLLSYFADKKSAHFKTIILAAWIMGIIFLLMLRGLIPAQSLQAALIIVGVMCSYQILAIYKSSTYVNDNLVGLTTALANMIIMTFGYFFHAAIGKIIMLNWDGTVINQVPKYNTQAFTAGLSIIPLGLFIAAIGFMLILWTEKNAVTPKKLQTT